LAIAANEEPWNGLLVCTSREFHSELIREHPALRPHPVLGKWLYLPLTTDGFEEAAQKLALQAVKNDPRIGVEPRTVKRKRTRRRK